jgi:hypothetical protein
MTKNKTTGKCCEDCYEFKQMPFVDCPGYCWNGKSDHFAHVLHRRHPACKNIINKDIINKK